MRFSFGFQSSGGGGGGSGVSYDRDTFTSADLSGGQLAVNHGLGEQYPSIIRIYDDNDQSVPEGTLWTYDASGVNNGAFIFSGPVSNTWRYVIGN